MFANYEDRLANGEVEIRELVVSKRITREPRDYQKAGVTAIAAQQLFGSGVKLRPGQNIEYVITNAEAHVPNDRVRAYYPYRKLCVTYGGCLFSKRAASSSGFAASLSLVNEIRQTRRGNAACGFSNRHA